MQEPETWAEPETAGNQAGASEEKSSCTDCNLEKLGGIMQSISIYIVHVMLFFIILSHKKHINFEITLF